MPLTPSLSTPQFASWIGGDRDGNPNVTPSVTKEVVMTLRLRAAKLIGDDLQALYEDLAISKSYSKEMDELADRVMGSPDVMEKYRRVLRHFKRRMDATGKVRS